MSKESKTDKYRRERDDAHEEITRLVDIIRTNIVNANEMTKEIDEMAEKIGILESLNEANKALAENQRRIVINMRDHMRYVANSLIDTSKRYDIERED